MTGFAVLSTPSGVPRRHLILLSVSLTAAPGRSTHRRAAKDYMGDTVVLSQVTVPRQIINSSPKYMQHMRDCLRSQRLVSGDSVVCGAMSLQSPGPRSDGRAGMDRRTHKPLSPAQEL